MDFVVPNKGALNTFVNLIFLKTQIRYPLAGSGLDANYVINGVMTGVVI